jgi:DNA polymerase I-like protein with 3'-5' exonuclease and polymerase domains
LFKGGRNAIGFYYVQARCDGRWIGGVQPSACATAPALPEVLQQLQLLTDGQLLVGHGLAKDLAALGLQHPADLTFDTMMHPAFCNPSGNSKNLQQLARQFLAQAIQQAQQPVQQQQRRRLRGSNSRAKQKERQQQQQQETCVRLLEQAALQHHQQQASRQQVLPQVFSKSGHDPEEDAAAVMQLYQQVRTDSVRE